MIRLTVIATALFPLLATSARAEDAKPPKNTTILLDGIVETVNFNDGDSFRVLEGPRKDQKARIIGYNTLEGYGPVHFWGSANGWDLYHVNERDVEIAKSERWKCTSQGKADGYGRILVSCPDLRSKLVQEGLAHVYAYGDEIPDRELVDLMLRAQNERRGMWAFGVPVAIVTSVHSADEKDPDGDPGESKKSYNRLADTQTGKTFSVEHDKVFKPCDVFCHSGSCMVYVPFKMRFGKDRPACMRSKEGEKNRMDGPNHLNEPLAQPQ